MDKRLTIEIDSDLKREFKTAVTFNGTTLKEVLEDFMRAYIRRFHEVKGAAQ